MGALWFALACLAVVGVAWWMGLDAIRDPGPYDAGIAGDVHWWLHLLGAAATYAGGRAVFQAPAGAAACIALGAWLLVELAQRHPRLPYSHGGRGHWSWPDVLADGLGVAVAVLVERAVLG